ncbi:MAG TPA: carboxymuconolactone decarboxylase family protein [Xanthobacteraceae bacterium]|nr:carboxymuconolactone decarboxylase family protein [Xanthobacteraceae bacterium]
MNPQRFTPLTPETMTPEQREVADEIMAGPRKGMRGPFNALLRSPALADRAQKLGEYVRFKTSIPPRLNELAILLTARHWTAQYEWYAHAQLALKAGLAADVVAAIAAGQRPASLQPEETIVYDFCHQVLETGQASDTSFKAAVDQFGERGAVDLIGVMGYYSLVAMVLNVDRVPIPDGGKLPLAALK